MIIFSNIVSGDGQAEMFTTAKTQGRILLLPVRGKI